MKFNKQLMISKVNWTTYCIPKKKSFLIWLLKWILGKINIPNWMR